MIVDTYSICTELHPDVVLDADASPEFRAMLFEMARSDWYDRLTVDGGGQPLPGPLWCRITQNPPTWARSMPRVYEYAGDAAWYLVASGLATR